MNLTCIPATAGSADSNTSTTRAACSMPSPLSTNEVPLGNGSAKPMNAPEVSQSRTLVERPTTTPA